MLWSDKIKKLGAIIILTLKAEDEVNVWYFIRYMERNLQYVLFLKSEVLQVISAMVPLYQDF